MALPLARVPVSAPVVENVFVVGGDALPLPPSAARPHSAELAVRVLEIEEVRLVHVEFDAAGGAAAGRGELDLVPVACCVVRLEHVEDFHVVGHGGVVARGFRPVQKTIGMDSS